MSTTNPESIEQGNGNTTTSNNFSSPNRGRGGGRGRGSNRGRGSSRGGRNTQRSTTVFKGNTCEMNGHVFQCFNEGADQNQFARSVEALGEYIAKNVKYPGDMMALTKDLSEPTVKKPEELPEDETSNLKKTVWKKQVDNYVLRLEHVEQNLKAIFAVTWGQCSESMKAKLKSLPDYTVKDSESDCVWLLKAIRGIMLRFEGQRYVFLSLDDALQNLCSFKQGPDTTLANYLEEFRNLVDVFEHYGGTIGSFPGLIEAAEGETIKEKQKNARDKALALSFLKRADRRRFGVLWVDLENQYSRGNDQYPNDLTEAYSLLVSYKATRTHETNRSVPSSVATPVSDITGLTFTQAAAIVPGTDTITHLHITCYNCQAKGHYASACPSASAVQLLQTDTDTVNNTETEQSIDDNVSVDTTTHEFTFANVDIRYGLIPQSWVLLDSQSTVSVFCNKDFLSNIRQSPQSLKVYTNGGTQTSSLVGDVSNFGPVWYNPHSLANILSLADVRKQCRVTMDTAIEASLCVHKVDGTIMKFTEYVTGLYYFDAANQPTTNTGYTFVTTVAGNKKRFHRREIEGADRARELYGKIGRPSYQHFEHILKHNLIRNCPVTVDDAKRAQIIYGPDIAALKGKSTRSEAHHVPTFIPTSIPAPILEDHQDVTLCMDFFFVQGLPFIHTISRKIKFRTVSHVSNQRKETMLREAKLAVELYRARGFNVTNIHADMEFECIQHELLPTFFDFTPRDAHVGEVERSIRTIKERVRSDIHAMPYQRLPKLMIIELVRRAVKVLNQFPALDGISDTLSPLNIMTGKANPDYTRMKLDFGAYAQVFEDNDPTNTAKSRRTGAIALNPTGNEQGDYHFMSLTTGRRLARRQWTMIPMPDTVIAAVESRAEAEGQPLIVGGCPIFEWHPQQAILDLTDDGEVYENEQDDDQDEVQDDTSEERNEEVVHRHVENIYVDPGLEADDDNDTTTNASESSDSGSDASESSEEDVNNDNTENNTADNVEVDNAAHNHDTANEGAQEPTPYGYNLRSNRDRNYSHRLDHHMDNSDNTKSYDAQFQMLQHAAEIVHHDPDEMYKYIFGHVMTQMTATAGIKKHGQKAIDALFSEFCQLDDKSVFRPTRASDLTTQQKRSALRAVNLIKEKRCGKLKGRTCADGSSQRDQYTKEQTASPTVSTDALMLTLMIDALEHRDVATADVVGAYLLADMDDFTVMKLTGDTVDIMCRVNPKYETFVSTENGKKVLYLQLLKALYGCVRSALLWYELFATTLQGMGFVLNPYDPCVANKEINGNQCTIVWYVDDNKISHVDAKVVTDVIEKIENKFGKMTVTRGNEHIFLGMKITMNQNGTVTINMKDYVMEAIKECKDDISKSATTPAKKDLFETNDNSELLVKEKAELFHSVVAKLLYISKRGRIDIQLAVAFLCTRVSCCTETDWTKLKRVLQYLYGTVNDCLTLGADCLTVLKTWVDAAYGVHQDMKSHTGGVISLGRGAIMCKSAKQKLNTKSSTEAELVGASDYLPNTIWAKMFLGAQGYIVKENIFAQDNQSAMKLEINGRASCGQKSRHIDIRYFFMKDRIKSEGINIVYCPTEQMLADFFTKPLQGSLFNKFKRVLMGDAHINTLSRQTSSSDEERVGKEVLNITAEDNESPKQCDSDVDMDGRNGWTVVERARRGKRSSSEESSDKAAADNSKTNKQRVHSFN
jgi:hypothetical protein